MSKRSCEASEAELALHTQWRLHTAGVNALAYLDVALEKQGVLPVLRRADVIDDPDAYEAAREMRRKLRKLTLSNDAVWERERSVRRSEQLKSSGWAHTVALAEL